MITYMRLVKMGFKSQAFHTQTVQFWWGSCVSLTENKWELGSLFRPHLRIGEAGCNCEWKLDWPINVFLENTYPRACRHIFAIARSRLFCQFEQDKTYMWCKYEVCNINRNSVIHFLIIPLVRSWWLFYHKHCWRLTSTIWQGEWLKLG